MRFGNLNFKYDIYCTKLSFGTNAINLHVVQYHFSKNQFHNYHNARIIIFLKSVFVFLLVKFCDKLFFYFVYKKNRTSSLTLTTFAQVLWLMFFNKLKRLVQNQKVKVSIPLGNFFLTISFSMLLNLIIIINACIIVEKFYRLIIWFLVALKDEENLKKAKFLFRHNSNSWHLYT